MAGELGGDVQDAVAQAFGFGDLVLAIEGECLGADGDVVRDHGEFKQAAFAVKL